MRGTLALFFFTSNSQTICKSIMWVWRFLPLPTQSKVAEGRCLRPWQLRSVTAQTNCKRIRECGVWWHIEITVSENWYKRPNGGKMGTYVSLKCCQQRQNKSGIYPSVWRLWSHCLCQMEPPKATKLNPDFGWISPLFPWEIETLFEAVIKSIITQFFYGFQEEVNGVTGDRSV